MKYDSHSVLIVTKDVKITSLTSAILAAPLFETEVTGDFNHARRIVNDKHFDIIIVDYAEGNGMDFVNDICELSSSIILLCPNESYEQVSYKVETSGVITVPCPFDAMYFYNIIKVAIAVQYKVQQISSQTIKLKEKMEEIRLVNRAKMLLIEKQQMSEQDAHRYIEKQAMDKCLKKTVISQQIIDSLS